MGMLKSILEKTIFGRKSFQSFFSKLYVVAIKGMNYGGGANCDSSGELFAIQYISSKLGKDLIIFDVGANIGEYSKSLKDIFGNRAIVHCFEPSDVSMNKLKDLLKTETGVVTVAKGLSDAEGKLELYADSATSGLASVYQRNLEHYHIPMNVIQQIDLTTVDLYCEKNQIQKIDFLKLDVEGHELKVLNGAKRMIESGNIRFIQFEFGGCDIDSKTFFQDFYYLLKDRYHIYRIVRDGLVPIKQYSEHLEIFSTINFLAERK